MVGVGDTQDALGGAFAHHLEQDRSVVEDVAAQECRYVIAVTPAPVRAWSVADEGSAQIVPPCEVIVAAPAGAPQRIIAARSPAGRQARLAGPGMGMTGDRFPAPPASARCTLTPKPR